MPLKYLITGATGSLGGQALRYLIENVPKSVVGAASSNPSNKSKFEDLGIAFRHLDYDDPRSLVAGLRDVENLLFVSTGSNRRGEQHGNVINAAKEARVKHVWYTSLAYGGYSNDSKVTVQQGHLLTERLLKESGINWTSIREGIYAEAFDILIDWYATREVVTLPADGEIAFTSRPELAEATARLMIRGGFERQIVLLTATETLTPKQIVEIINETTGRDTKLEFVSREEYLQNSSQDDPRGKPMEWFETIASWWDEISQGGLSTTDPLMQDLLGREPTKPRDVVRMLLEQNRDYSYL